MVLLVKAEEGRSCEHQATSGYYMKSEGTRCRAKSNAETQARAAVGRQPAEELHSSY